MAIVQDGSRFFEVNYSPAAGAGEQVLWHFAQVLQAAGWVGVQSSNGTAKTAGFPGANPFVAGTTGWIQLRTPTGTFEITIQRDSGNDYDARAYACMTTFGTGGSASAPPTPPGTAWQIVGVAGAYDAWIWGTTDASAYRWHFCADSVAVGGFYYFHAIARSRTPAYPAHRALILDPVDTLADGTVGDADQAPFVMLRGQGVFPNLDASGDLVAWYRYGLSGAVLDDTASIIAGGPYLFTSRGTNPYTLIHEKAPLDLFRQTVNIQDKGRTRNLRWFSDTAISTYDTVDLIEVGEALIHFDNSLLVPWPSGTAPIP